jgi:hypothetical protein
MIKKGIILLTIVLIFIFGSVGIYVNTDLFKVRLKFKLEENFSIALNNKVTIRQIAFSPFSGQLVLKDIDSRKYGKVEKVSLNFSVLNLFKRRLVVNDAEIKGVNLIISLNSSSAKTIKPEMVFRFLDSALKKNKIKKLTLSEVRMNFVKDGKQIGKLMGLEGFLNFLEKQKRYKVKVNCKNGQWFFKSKKSLFACDGEFFLTRKQLSVNNFQVSSGNNTLKISGNVSPNGSLLTVNAIANISDFTDISPVNKAIAKLDLRGSLEKMSGLVALETDVGNIAGEVEIESNKKTVKFAKCKCNYKKSKIEISGRYVFENSYSGFLDLNISGEYFKKIELHGQFNNKSVKSYTFKGLMVDNAGNISQFFLDNIHNVKLPVVKCSFPFLNADIKDNNGVVDFNFKNFKGKLKGKFLKDKLFNGFAYFEKFNLFNTQYPEFQSKFVADYKGNIDAKTITLYDNAKGYAVGSGKFSKTGMELDMNLHSLDFKTGLFIADNIDNLDISGKLNGSVTVKGQYDNISVFGSVSLHNALIFQTVFKRVLADFNYHNRYLTISNILALNGKDGLKGNGVIDLEKETLDFNLKGENINLVYKPVDFFQLNNANGVLEVKGSLEHPLIKSDLTFANAFIGAKDFGKGYLKLNTVANCIFITVNTLSGLKVNTSVNFNGSLDFNVTAHNLEMELNNEYKGIFSGQFKGFGNYNKIEDIIGKGVVTKGFIFSDTLNIKLLPIELRLKGLNIFAKAIKVNYTDSNLALRNALLNLENMKIKGEIEGDGHLLILNHYIEKEFGVNIKTNYTVKGEISGTLDNPVFQGNIKTANGIAKIKGLPFAIENINADCDFDPSLFKIKNISATYGDGAGSVSGFIAHDGTLEIKAFFEKIPFDASGIYALVDGYLLLKNGIDNEINAKGTLKVAKTYIEENQLTMSANSFEHVDIFDRINLDMTLEVQNASFENEMMQVSLKPSVLSLKGTPNSPVLLGTLHLSNESIIAINDIPMKISRGSVIFDNPFEISPFINLVAETEIQGYGIACKIRGNVNKSLSVKFNSTPPLEKNELFALLFGSGGINAGTNYYSDPTVSNSTDLTAAGIAIALNNLFSPFQKKVKNKLNVERFQITPQVFNTKGDPSPIITVEKDMSSRLTATYSQTVSGSGENLLQFRYRTSLGNYVIMRKEVDNTFTLEFEFIKKD